MYLNTFNYFKYFCYNKMVKLNKPLIIKSVKSAMHSLLTSLVLTVFKCIFHCFISSYFSFEVDKRFEELMFIKYNQWSINIHVSAAYICRCAIIMACTVAT